MSNPEQHQAFDATGHFNELFDYAQQAAASDHALIREYIRGRPELEQLMENYAREGYDEATAIGMARGAAEPADRDEPHPFDIIKQMGRELAQQQLHDSFAATGLGLTGRPADRIKTSAYEHTLGVADVHGFAAALQSSQTAEQEDALQRNAEILSDITGDMLSGMATVAWQKDRTGYASALGRDRYDAPEGWPFDMDNIRARDVGLAPDHQFVDALLHEIDPLANVTSLQQELGRHGVASHHITALDHLHLADQGALLGAWAAAVDIGVYRPGAVGELRLGSEQEWQDAIALLDHLGNVAPHAGFTAHLQQKLLEDIQQELDRPFDPAEDDGWVQGGGTVTFHDSMEEIEDGLAEQEINMIMQPPPLPSEADMRAIRQARRNHTVQLLTRAKQYVLATMPPEERPEPLQQRKYHSHSEPTLPDSDPTVTFIQRLIETMHEDPPNTPGQEPQAGTEQSDE
jgi:hypothetical protein